MNIRIVVIIFIALFCIDCKNIRRNTYDKTKLAELLIDLTKESNDYFDKPVIFIDSITLCKIGLLAKEIKTNSNPDDSSIIKMVNKLLFEKLKITFIDERSDIDNLMPRSILKNRKGSCLGLSIVILLLGEVLGLPLYGVVVPGHIFVRYDNQSEKINIETMKCGANMPDNWYIEKFLQNGKNTVTTNLGKEKIVALIHYNMGNICLEKHEYKLALKNYRRTLNLMPEFTEARGNMAIGLERSGYLDRALHELLLLKKNGQHNIDKNIAILYLKKGDFKNAKTFFLNALRESEKDNEILYGLAVSEYNLRN